MVAVGCRRRRTRHVTRNSQKEVAARAVAGVRVKRRREMPQPLERESSVAVMIGLAFAGALVCAAVFGATMGATGGLIGALVGGFAGALLGRV
jgi:hypothetical protein